MVFTLSDWIWSCLTIALQSFAFWKIKQLAALRWLLAFLTVADVLCIAVRNYPLVYWDVYWLCKQIALVWWVGIACQLSFPEMSRFARIPPFVAACVFVAYNPLKSIYSELKYAEAHVYGIALIAVIVGFISGLVSDRLTKWALAFAPVLASLGGLALWAWYYGTPRISQAVWLVCLFVLILCESRSRGLSGSPHLQA